MSMDKKVYYLNENGYLIASSVPKILNSHIDGESLQWFDIAQPDQVALTEFLTI